MICQICKENIIDNMFRCKNSWTVEKGIYYHEECLEKYCIYKNSYRIETSGYRCCSCDTYKFDIVSSFIDTLEEINDLALILLFLGLPYLILRKKRNTEFSYIHFLYKYVSL